MVFTSITQTHKKYERYPTAKTAPPKAAPNRVHQSQVHHSTGRPAFAEDVSLFDENVDEIQKLALQQAIGSKGKTQAKKLVRAKMADVTLEVSAGGAAVCGAPHGCGSGRVRFGDALGIDLWTGQAGFDPGDDGVERGQGNSAEDGGEVWLGDRGA